MCSFFNKVKKMQFSNCNLFKRSFTNKGLGFSFNIELGRALYKRSLILGLQMKVFMLNDKIPVKSVGSEHALQVILENNFEETERFEKTKDSFRTVGEIQLKPKGISVSLHNPKEPANIRSKSFKIPLGHSTTVYITPKAREIDDSGKELSEVQRGCRLAKDSHDLDLFNIYSKEACILECLIKQAYQRCECFPWSYLIKTKVQHMYNNHSTV